MQFILGTIELHCCPNYQNTAISHTVAPGDQLCINGLQVHGKKILKLLQKIFSWLPVATVIDRKVLIVHGGISDMTDLNIIARMERHKVREAFSIIDCIWGILHLKLL